MTHSMCTMQPNRYKEHIQNKHADEAAGGGPEGAPAAQVPPGMSVFMQCSLIHSHHGSPKRSLLP